MPKGRRAPKRKLNLPLVVGALLLLVAGVGYAGLRDDAPAHAGRDVVFADLHGLAASPTDAGVVIAATHEGLVRYVHGEGWAHVGKARDDFMGFTMHPTSPDTFWTSGHPASGGNMGVRRSDDGGRSWRTLWPEAVDFHAMTVSPADAQRLYGWWQREVLRSDDGGATWTVAGPAPAVRALAGAPERPDVLYAATGAGVARSVDAGATWTPLAGIPAFGVAADPTDARVLYAGGEGALWKSGDGGATWTPLTPPHEGTFAFLSVSRADPQVVYAGSYDRAVFRSEDGGGTWTRLR